MISNSNLKKRSLNDKPSIKLKLANSNRRNMVINLTLKTFRLGKVKVNKNPIKVKTINAEKGLTNWTKILNH